MNASLICHTVPETEKIMEKEDTLKQKSYNVHIVHQVADGALRCFASTDLSVVKLIRLL